jgi:zinc/manganese transport system ATP-binding protein
MSDVSFAIRPGEFIGVLGPNGAGKTTLLCAILGLLRPSTGEIRVLGSPPLRGNRAAGYLPQQRTSGANICLSGWAFVASALRGDCWGLPLTGGTGRREVERVVAAVDGQRIAARRLCELSGGEVKRLLLAQALLGKPKLLLLDEPLSSLDPHFQQAIVGLVKRIQQAEQITVLFTAHDLNPLVSAMDRVLYLGHGGAALGPVHDVVTSEVLSRLYGMDIDVVHVKDRILISSGHGLIGAETHDV